MLRKLRIPSVIVAVVALSSLAYAFTAANIVPATNAGDGNNAISGYTITNVEYTLDTNPANIASVSFDIAPSVAASGNLQIKLVSSGSTWYTCSLPAAPTTTCLTAGATVLAADELRVIASN